VARVVLANDDVHIGAHHHGTLDLTNPYALADAAGATVEEIADRLFDLLDTAPGGAAASTRSPTGRGPTGTAPPRSGRWPSPR